MTIHTDGGCRGNPGPGAWAAMIEVDGERREISGFEAQTTNNRMELTAAIRALEALEPSSRVRVFTDSEYLRNGITDWMSQWKSRGWKTSKRKPVRNQDLWMRLDELCAAHEIRWDWVRGHSGHPENERCDELVNQKLDENSA